MEGLRASEVYESNEEVMSGFHLDVMDKDAESSNQELSSRVKRNQEIGSGSRLPSWQL